MDQPPHDSRPGGISRRAFIKGVIASGAVGFVRGLLFRGSGGRSSARRPPRLGRAPDHAQRQRPDAPRRRDEAGNAGHDAPLQARAHRHEDRLRPRRVRRLHGPHRRRAALLLLGADPHGAGRRGADDRRARRADGTLHPVQQAVVDEQGFQCAFCMPGFVMAAVGFLKTNPNPTRAGAGARRLRQSVPLPGLRQDPHRPDARR